MVLIVRARGPWPHARAGTGRGRSLRRANASPSEHCLAFCFSLLLLVSSLSYLSRVCLARVSRNRRAPPCPTTQNAHLAKVTNNSRYDGVFLFVGAAA